MKEIEFDPSGIDIWQNKAWLETKVEQRAKLLKKGEKKGKEKTEKKGLTINR